MYFWKEQNIYVDRVLLSEPIKELVVPKVLVKEDAPEEVLTIFNKYKTKQAICNGMAKKFKDSKTESAIYKILKPLLKEKNKS